MYPNVDMINGDITDDEIYNEILSKSKKNKINFIMATPPCQGMSKAGRMKVDDARNKLFLYILKLIKELKPKYVLIENVSEFLKFNYINPKNEKEEKILNKIKIDTEYNYKLNYKVLDAKDYDVPQTRKRAIVLLSRKDQDEWYIPESITKKENYITVGDTIKYLPSLESGDKITDENYHSNIRKWHFAKKHNEDHILWMKHTPTGKSAFDNETHYPKTIDKKTGEIRRIKGFKTTYKRMDWDKPAPTITMSSGSISSQNNVHPGNKMNDNTYSDARVLTVFELILLTSLPEDIILPENVNEKLLRDLFGECVPSKFMFNLIKSIPN